ncbi:RidA family protein [Flavobacterium sp. HSC-61S13]|uniref:RidA family protein n=1 Tax=Flavobacterium sp. HSC-61S13 TaxID=2910963 RepID=UPI0020A1D002|nr:RidA family protein [Flavobacterium sp. HSC-61S13]MCP1994366.1 reactive intermediate/imine deaminase [Flavobacterium sp. HSC-61S13]
MEIIKSQELPQSNGHYSTAIISNNTLYLSGQLPIDKEGNHYYKHSFEEQFNIIFENIDHILTVSGSSLQQVVKVTAYITDVALWSLFNEFFKNYFGTHKPVRTVVPVAALHYGYKLEVEVIAEVN